MSKNDIEIVKDFYDQNPELEWNRLEKYPFEFFIARHFIERYITSGQQVLDIGGGPGRYSLFLAEYGCDVTLLDLSKENVKFALQKAEEAGLPLKGIAGDARRADEIAEGPFDAILLMGPLYHLLEEADREKAVNSALNLLKPGGVLFTSFISICGGMAFCMREIPQALIDPKEKECIAAYCENRMFCGDGFTKACMFAPREIRPFMERFPLKTLHLVGQESISAPCVDRILSQPPEVIEAWKDLCLAVCEREDLLSFSEHILHIAQKV